MNVDTLARNLLFSTVRVRNFSPLGESKGTSFLMAKPLSDGRSMYALVTNKHVVKDAQMLILDFIARDPTADRPLLGQGLEVPLPAPTWIGHPTPDVDVAVIPIAGLLEQLSDKIFVRPLDVDLLPKAETFIDAIEEVTFIGYPDGQRDEFNRTPIVRRGITATPIELALDGKPAFLVDGSVFGGSSGSPVFLFEQGTYRVNATDITVGTRLVLVGIIAATYTREHQLPLEVSAGPHVKLAKEFNLGLAYHWTAIKEVLDLLESMIPARELAKGSPEEPRDPEVVIAP